MKVNNTELNGYSSSVDFTDTQGRALNVKYRIFFIRFMAQWKLPTVKEREKGLFFYAPRARCWEINKKVKKTIKHIHLIHKRIFL